MPQLVDGKWETGDVAASEMKGGAFHREPTSFRNWITANGEPGPEGQPALPAEAGRYQLFVAFICPWASRTLMMRNLKGLQDIISVSISEPELGENGWTYAEPQDAGPRTAKIRYQHQLYTASDPHYTGKVPFLFFGTARRAGSSTTSPPISFVFSIRPSIIDGRPAGFLSTEPAPRHRPLECADLRPGEQRRLPGGFCQDAERVRRGRDWCFRHAGYAECASCCPSLCRRDLFHRSRYPAVRDADPL